MSRALFHDVRGVLGAAASNVDFLRSRAAAPDVSPVLDEIAHELRLVADVIALAGASDDRVVELDVRALLFFARGTRSFAVDATHAPFVVRAHRSALVAFASEVVDAASRGAAVEVSGGACLLHGLESNARDRLRNAAVLGEAALVATVEGESLVVRRATEQELPGAGGR